MDGGGASAAGDFVWTHGTARWTGGSDTPVTTHALCACVRQRRAEGWRLIFETWAAVNTDDMTEFSPRNRLRTGPLHRRPYRAPSAPWPSPCATAGVAAACLDDLRDEVTPKNILMIGPTGVGKTEIARRPGQAGPGACS